MYGTPRLLTLLLIAAMAALAYLGPEPLRPGSSHPGADSQEVSLESPIQRASTKPEPASAQVRARRKLFLTRAEREPRLRESEGQEPSHAPPTLSSAAAQREPKDPGSWLWPRLTPPAIHDDQVSAALRGHDPVGPRRLELWRLDAQGAHRMGETTSDAHGRFDFGRIALPQAGLQLVVTPPGVDPASVTPLRLSRPTLSPPHVSVEYTPQRLRAWIVPARLEGELQVWDEADRMLLSLPIKGEPVHVEFDRSDLTQALQITHSLPGGSRSRPHLFHIPPEMPSEIAHLKAPGDTL